MKTGKASEEEYQYLMERNNRLYHMAYFYHMSNKYLYEYTSTLACIRPPSDETNQSHLKWVENRYASFSNPQQLLLFYIPYYIPLDYEAREWQRSSYLADSTTKGHYSENNCSQIITFYIQLKGDTIQIPNFIFIVKIRCRNYILGQI